MLLPGFFNRGRSVVTCNATLALRLSWAPSRVLFILYTHTLIIKAPYIYVNRNNGNIPYILAVYITFVVVKKVLLLLLKNIMNLQMKTTYNFGFRKNLDFSGYLLCTINH